MPAHVLFWHICAEVTIQQTGAVLNLSSLSVVTLCARVFGNGPNRLRKGTGIRKLHIKRDQKQVPEPDTTESATHCNWTIKSNKSTVPISGSSNIVAMTEATSIPRPKPMNGSDFDIGTSRNTTITQPAQAGLTIPAAQQDMHIRVSGPLNRLFTYSRRLCKVIDR